MANYLIIRIVPLAPVTADVFLMAVSGLTIKAANLTFDSIDDPQFNLHADMAVLPPPPGGWSSGSGGLTATALPSYPSLSTLPFSAGVGLGYQQVDALLEIGVIEAVLMSVATVIIPLPASMTSNNFRIQLQLATQTITVANDFYDVAVFGGPIPDLSTWTPGSDFDSDPWGAIPASLYLSLPASTNGSTSLQLPSNGSPPPFDELKTAVDNVLGADPGASVTLTVSAAPAIGATTLHFANTTGVTIGMAASGAGIAVGTTVTSIDTTGNVTLSEETTGAVSNATFQWNLATLTFDQCKNIAYEIIWSQQASIPAVPGTQGMPSGTQQSDVLSEMYTDPPNGGQLMNGSSINQPEGDREQFEASLKGYYAIADANADRLTTFVFALSAAVACEQFSLAQTQVTLEFPADPGQSSSEVDVLLTGIATVDIPTNFGVPAGYFYALGATQPEQLSAQQRFTLATLSSFATLLPNFTSAINAGTITDAEGYVTVAGTINAAQAARRLVAMETPSGNGAPLAPLDTVVLTTSAAAASGPTLTFASVGSVVTGMQVAGPGVPLGSTGTIIGNTVKLNQPLLNAVPAGTSIVFTPGYSVALTALIQAWLNYPAAVPGVISSQTYQPTNDASQFWIPNTASPGAATALLNLVLSALTQDYIITAGTVQAVTAMSANGTMVTVTATNTLSPGQFVTITGVTPTGFNGTYQVASATASNFTYAVPASLTNITTVGSAAAISVSMGDQIIAYLTALGLPSNVGSLASLTPSQWTSFLARFGVYLPPFTLPGSNSARIAAFVAYVQQFFQIGTDSVPTGVVPVAATPLPLLPAPLVANDCLAKTLDAYVTATGAAFSFGNGFAAATLQTAATGVLPNDTAAQNWVVDALVTIDALYKVMATVTMPPAVMTALPNVTATTAMSISGTTVTVTANNTLSAGQFVTITGVTPAAYNGVYSVTSATSSEFTYVVTSNAGAIAPAGSAAASPAAFVFSVVEALYARGFKSASDITELSSDEFTQAMSGTVAFDISGSAAGGIYNSAAAIANPPQQTSSGGGSFSPVNPDGTLTNCIPPACLSPLGPITYLNELLQLSPASTCKTPFTTGAAITVNSVMTQRRGSLGSLLADCANCETPLPMIDLVNECLEFIGSVSPVATPVVGTIYNTSADQLAGYPLCQEDACHSNDHGDCCDPPRVFAALPEYSTPAIPVAANNTVEPAVYNILKNDFSACCLPYSQALDVSRSYLRQLGSCRFEEMRTFRKCITEFVLGPTPANEPVGFPSHLWRYPVRIDIAIEYLGISPEVYTTIFEGATAAPCYEKLRQIPDGEAPQAALLANPLSTALPGSRAGTVTLPAFLDALCLSYCEFIELWKCGYFPISNGPDSRQNSFPDCEPCCLDHYTVQLPVAGRNPDRENPNPPIPGFQQSIGKLIAFVRLYRLLKDSCCFCYSFADLRDICDVLQLYTATGINPDFIRQFAAFQMLRDHFKLRVVDPADKPAAGAIDDSRTYILALWVGNTAAKWPWAVRELLRGIEAYAIHRHSCHRRPPSFINELEAHLDRLSHLFGFDPTVSTDTWQASPTHTLRFAELLSKIYASHFSMGEILYLFTIDPMAGNHHLFPMPEQQESLEWPLALPEDGHEHSLWELRERLLCAEVSYEDAEKWGWNRIEGSLRTEFGFKALDILDLGRHFFPSVVRGAGYQVNDSQMRFTSALAVANTTPAKWAPPPDGPFGYDGTSLFVQLPVNDGAVFEQIKNIAALNAFEQTAVQDLFYQPRAMLAQFAFVFADFTEAQDRMIQHNDHHERWNYFRHQFALCRARCEILARHLSNHVSSICLWHEQHRPEPCTVGDAFQILKSLKADENEAVNWEISAAVPATSWAGPNGSAFAALLGLIGTGLLREFTPDKGAVLWRDVTGPSTGFGFERDRNNVPVPTIIPSLALAAIPNVNINNGFASDSISGEWLGGAQGFSVKSSGVLLIEREGAHDFRAGAPTPGDAPPDLHAIDHCQWRVTLTRGTKSWVVLSHNWPGPPVRVMPCPHLRRGAYSISIEFMEPAPTFTAPHLRRLHTGFQVKYCGPDTGDCLIEIPHNRLFRDFKNMQLVASPGLNDVYQDLGWGITGLAAGATSYLDGYYTSSLRDIRRTYQRASKALLFAHRLGLSSKRREDDHHSEFGFFIAHPDLFAGQSYYRTAGGGSPVFSTHIADFDLSFLPVDDNFHSPTAAQDLRVQPTAMRSQAMFDWWERFFDYTQARAEVRRAHDRELWGLFDEAVEKNPTDPSSLLRHLGAEESCWKLELQYYQGFSIPYEVTAADLSDDRWVVRAWHANKWLTAMQCAFACRDIKNARPDLWASNDPSAVLGGQPTGNSNLVALVCDGYLKSGRVRRYEDLKRLNDGLRERGRKALVAYLCSSQRVPLPMTPGQFAQVPRDLSDLLLIDVESGIREQASRIDEAITAVQNFIRRARLQLEPGWAITSEFARLWDREFATLQVWQACKRRHLYKENYVEWSELEKARRVEAYRFLEDRLQSAELSIAVPGGVEWWPGERPATHEGLTPMQAAEPSQIRRLPTAREGLNLLGIPERDARPSWMTAVPVGLSAASPTGSGPANAGGSSSTQSASEQVPFWLQTAIRLGTVFVRLDAAGVPWAGNGFKPHRGNHKGCVNCCDDCCCEAHSAIDEYWFWLINGSIYKPALTPDAVGATTTPGDYVDGYQTDFYDPTQQEATLWEDITMVPQLLDWKGSPTVRLAWCRVHNGQFQQPRRSHKGVQVDPTQTIDVIFLGRSGDSFTFQVTGGITPTGYPATPLPGFRYDMAIDAAAVLPEISPSTNQLPFNGGYLPAYPFFVYQDPGTHLFPLSWFSPSIAVASALRAHCRFEAATKWYQLAFNPLENDCAWVRCASQSSGGSLVINAPGNSNTSGLSVAIYNPLPDQGTCCDSTDVSCSKAKDRSILMHYLETLREWGDALMRHGNCPESFQQARVIFDSAARILGKTPVSVKQPPPVTPTTVATFQPGFAPLNPRLLDLYETINDRLELVHESLNAKRRRNGSADHEMPYFGNSPLREGWKTNQECCGGQEQWCQLSSPYRFAFLIQKAQEYASKVQEFGAALLAAIEKGDGEYLASLRAGHESELLTLGLDIKKDQWRSADWEIESLQKTKAVSQSNLIYYNGLIQAGLISGELAYQDLTIVATVLRAAGDITQALAQGADFVPNTFVGVAGFGGTPLNYYQIPIGEPMSSAFSKAASIMNNLAEISTTTAGLELTEASWQRRNDEWVHQTQTLAIEIQQVERQILGAQRRRHAALHELDNQQRQIEQSTEVQNFLRDKFSSQERYLFMQKETAALFYKTYDMALQTARQAQHAFNLERGHTTRHFLPEHLWDRMQDGLMSGERLSTALRRMEKAYNDENVREYELSKSFSLRLHFPLEFLRLLSTGKCEIELPEWMFDRDFPGHYMRRIKSVTLTIPCVAGPYTGVHCRLTLIRSMTRVDPRLSAPPHECCCPHEPCDCDCGCGGNSCKCGHKNLARDYETCPDDPRVVRQYAARDAIATSHGLNDSGLFELNFSDERYLPFEFMGAVSKWRIELPPENNYFDMTTLSDMVLQLNYTSREGGDLLRRGANESAQHHLPGDGWCYFDVRHEFPNAWELFQSSLREPYSQRSLPLRFTRKMFPFLPGCHKISIFQMAILFSQPCDTNCDCPTTDGCPCPHKSKPDRYTLHYHGPCGNGPPFVPHSHRRMEHRPPAQFEKPIPVECLNSDQALGLYTGMIHTNASALHLGQDQCEVKFDFPDIGEIDHVYLLCRYRREC